MAAPTIRGVGAIASGTGTISPGKPTGTVEGDLLVMFTECDESETVSVSGWTEAPNSPQATASAATGTRGQVFYVIETAGGVSTTTNDPGDHVIGRIIGVQAGTFNASSVFDTGGCAGGVEETADTSAAIPGGTTTVADCLILAFCAAGFDPGSDGTTGYSGWTNANLTSVTEQIDNYRSVAGGGAIGVASGVKATAGAVGDTTVTLGAGTYKAMISLAIKPAGAVVDFGCQVAGAGTVTGSTVTQATLATAVNGVGAVTASSTGQRALTASVAGVAAVSAETAKQTTVGAAVTGTGAAVADATVALTIDVAVTGTGAVTPEATVDRPPAESATTDVNLRVFQTTGAL